METGCKNLLKKKYSTDFFRLCRPETSKFLFRPYYGIICWDAVFPSVFCSRHTIDRGCRILCDTGHGHADRFPKAYVRQQLFPTDFQDSDPWVTSWKAPWQSRQQRDSICGHCGQIFKANKKHKIYLNTISQCSYWSAPHPTPWCLCRQVVK